MNGGFSHDQVGCVKIACQKLCVKINYGRNIAISHVLAWKMLSYVLHILQNFPHTHDQDVLATKLFIE